MVALLLDLDGTLVDSDAAVARSWKRFCAEYGVDFDHVMRVHSGRPAASTIGLVAPWLDAAAAAAQLAYQYEDLDDVVAVPGAAELVAVLTTTHLRWAVLTSGDRRLATARLGAVGLTPPLLVTADDVTAGKPDPEGYLLAARKLGVRPEDCVVVEDAPAGVEAGRRAGMRVVGVLGVEADIAVDDLAQLVRLLPL